MNRAMEQVWVALLLVALCAPLCGASDGPELAPELRAAQQAFEANRALGDSLAGALAAEQQAAQAQQQLEEGLANARAYAKVHARSSQAHHLIGMLLVFAYRPVESKVTTTDEEGKQHEEKLVVLRRGSKADLEEGLAELRTATKLAPANVDYQLDYAEAFLANDEVKRSADLLNALWMRKQQMTGGQRARGAALLARAARAQQDSREEAGWLREVLRNDPQNETAAKRLAELGPVQQGAILWQTYEAGMRIAGQERKPVMIDFMAEWCGWCKKLDREVYTHPQVLAMSQKFVSIKVDGDRRRDLVRKYAVDGYPTIVFLDSQGRELHRVVGYPTATNAAEAFLAEMRKAAP